MKFKSEIEIRKLKGEELSSYALDFCNHFKTSDPTLLNLSKKLATDSKYEPILKTELIRAHNIRKAWPDVEVSNANSLSEQVEKTIDALAFDKTKFTVLNETVYDALKTSVANIFSTLVESNPQQADYILRSMLKTGFLTGISIENFDKLLDNLEVKGDEFRPMLHKLASFYRGKDKTDIFVRGLLKVSGVQSDKTKDFMTDISSVIGECVKVTCQVIEDNQVEAVKVKTNLNDKSWQDIKSSSTELVQYLQNMLDNGMFELTFDGNRYFRIDVSEHKKINGCNEVISNIRVIGDFLMDLYNAKSALQNSRPNNKEQNQKSYDAALLKYLEFGASDNLAPEQQLVFWHMLTSGMLKEILGAFEKAFDSNDKTFLNLLEKLKVRYEAFREYDSSFLDKSCINIDSVKLSIETGSPLTYAIEASLREDALRMANTGKYLSIRSKSSFPESNDLLPSAFAKSIGLTELSTKLAKIEKETTEPSFTNMLKEKVKNSFAKGQ